MGPSRDTAATLYDFDLRLFLFLVAAEISQASPFYQAAETRMVLEELPNANKAAPVDTAAMHASDGRCKQSGNGTSHRFLIF